MLRDAMNTLISYLILRFNPTKQSDLKNILFLEPRQQGFGDLLFQTPLFEALFKKGYKVSIIIQKKHLPIMLNNPYISNLYYWENIGRILDLPFKKYLSIIFLGKSTLTETLFSSLFINTNKTVLDQNINLWHKLFSENHTRAWQKLMQIYFDSNLQFNKPKIFFAKRSSIISNISNHKMAIIAGVDKTKKHYQDMIQLLELINGLTNTTIYLIGACDKKTETTLSKFRSGSFHNYINKLSYEDTVKLLSGMDTVIGTEGSLVHISTTLHIPTIIIEVSDNFWKYSDLEKNSNIKTLQGKVPPEQIFQEITRIENALNLNSKLFN